MAKRLSTRGIWKNRSYTYEQIADALRLSPQTVRKMKGQGLRVMEAARPHLILGADLIAFAKHRRFQTNVSLAADQLFCLRCRVAVRPLWMMVGYAPITATRGRLYGFCESCQGTCNRLIASSALPRLRVVFEISGDCGKQA